LLANVKGHEATKPELHSARDVEHIQRPRAEASGVGTAQFSGPFERSPPQQVGLVISTLVKIIIEGSESYAKCFSTDELSMCGKRDSIYQFDTPVMGN
jgi:hypothetical protein